MKSTQAALPRSAYKHPNHLQRAGSTSDTAASVVLDELTAKQLHIKLAAEYVILDELTVALYSVYSVFIAGNCIVQG
jgi:hypothetical protein